MTGWLLIPQNTCAHYNLRLLTFCFWMNRIVPTMTTNEWKEYLSKEKYDELANDLNKLKNVKRKEIAERLEFAKSLGDLSENAEYHEARQEQAEIEDRIAQLETIIQNASIIHKAKNGRIAVGSTVIVQRGSKKDEITYQIVGAEEANTAEGKISYKSPIGEMLIGKTKGEQVSCDTPGGKVVYKIIDVK